MGSEFQQMLKGGDWVKSCWVYCHGLRLQCEKCNPTMQPFPYNWTPELEASWRRDPAGVWQTLEEEDRQRKNRPGDPCDHMDGWVGRSIWPGRSK